MTSDKTSLQRTAKMQDVVEEWRARRGHLTSEHVTGGYLTSGRWTARGLCWVEGGGRGEAEDGMGRALRTTSARSLATRPQPFPETLHAVTATSVSSPNAPTPSWALLMAEHALSVARAPHSATSCRGWQRVRRTRRRWRSWIE